MTRSLVMPVVTLQTPLQRLEAAELASWFDGLTAIIELVPAGSSWPHTPRRYIGVEGLKDKRRFFYEWVKDGNDPTPGPAHPCPFNSMVLTRDEAIEMLTGLEPARMTQEGQQHRERWLDLQASEDAYGRLTPEQRDFVRAVAESIRIEPEGKLSSHNRAHETVTYKKRTRNRVLAQQSEAAAQRAALLP